MDDDSSRHSRLLSFLQSKARSLLINNFDGVFVSATLLAVGFILHFVDQKISLLNFFFVPTLLAGCLINTRSAVLGALLAAAWVTFFVVLNPQSFYQAMNRMSLYLHLLSWASFLIVTGVLVGGRTEQLRARFRKARKIFGLLRGLKRKLAGANKALEQKQSALETAKARVEAVLFSMVDPVVARLIIDRKLRNEKRPLTVLFADLANFTEQSERRTPESVINDLNRLFSAMEPVILRYHGHLDKYLGDGILVEFGIPQSVQNHALLGALAALKMQERMASGRFPWKMRVGIASGASLVGLVGSEQRKNYTAIGDTVN
ncbi:MAG: adenylate/guanylate cyclase domain-containing protein, partial [Candidatus Terrybacteria bacterium]|nr:adenylate/guanylate cyclase domain-containing protein [Candidatus Terrybacteria bacterium]